MSNLIVNGKYVITKIRLKNGQAIDRSAQCADSLAKHRVEQKIYRAVLWGENRVQSRPQLVSDKND